MIIFIKANLFHTWSVTSTPQKLKKFSSSGVKNGEYATEKRIPRRFDYVSTPPHSKSQDCAR